MGVVPHHLVACCLCSRRLNWHLEKGAMAFDPEAFLVVLTSSLSPLTVAPGSLRASLEVQVPTSICAKTMSVHLKT